MKTDTVAEIVGTTDPWFVLDDRDTARLYTTSSAHRVLPVSAADNPLLPSFGQRFALVCDEMSGNVRFDDVHITATFFAMSYQPTSFEVGS